MKTDDLSEIEAELALVAEAFGVDRPTAIEPLTIGHIHTTWRFTSATGDRYVAQRINRSIFDDLDACEETLRRVIEHLDGHRCGVSVPQYVRTNEGRYNAVVGSDAWRLSHEVLGAHAISVAPDTATARAAAVLFGRYTAALADLPGLALPATLPRFHDLRWRLEQLDLAAAYDRVGRVSSCAVLVVDVRNALYEVIRRIEALGPLPQRPTHGDAKIANLLFDDITGLPSVVLDLDTTMNAPVHVDLGEMLRSGGVTIREDESDTASTVVDSERVSAIREGFVEGLGETLSDVEVESLEIAGERMAIFNASRLLADHLDGDRYYRVQRPDQNLDRARTQYAVAQALVVQPVKPLRR